MNFSQPTQLQPAPQANRYLTLSVEKDPNGLNLHPARIEPKAGRYLTFNLGHESYGLPILHVRQIIRLCPITPVPNMPSHVKGVINFRGMVLAVLDLRAKFGITHEKYGERACIIILRPGGTSDRGTPIAVIVDAVEEVVQLHESEIEPAPDFGGAPNTQYISGVATIGNGVKTLLHIDKILQEEGTLNLALPNAPKTA
ncbi:MAG: chemotaxis protein CheW [Verrucomicrobia bacterium]|nr:chemotaxis protein CheW [Verrucomicrobiota bacterium]